MTDKPKRSGPGRPPHIPTDKERHQVSMMSAIGLTQPQMAKIMGISEDTLQRHYRHELDTGLSFMNSQVGENLFNIATSRGQGAVAAAIFWMKTRAQWREVTRTEHTGVDGGPLKVETQTIDVKDLTPEERSTIRQALMIAKEKNVRYDA